MRPIGFSTGALAYSDLKRGLEIVRAHVLPAIELSALREHELPPLLEAVKNEAFDDFQYVSVHAPSRISRGQEEIVVQQLRELADRAWPIVVHPDAISDPDLWRVLGRRLCIENMDKRKSTGRTVPELQTWFDEFPDASFCFDVGHAQQLDASMTEGYLLLKTFGNRLAQVHMSHVNANSKHDRLSWASISAFRRLAQMIPDDVPVILESTGVADEVPAEIERARQALSGRRLDRESPVLRAPQPAR